MAEAFPITGIPHAWPSRQSTDSWINPKLETANNKKKQNRKVHKI
jgi:hypothetical protein